MLESTNANMYCLLVRRIVPKNLTWRTLITFLNLYHTGSKGMSEVRGYLPPVSVSQLINL